MADFSNHGGESFHLHIDEQLYLGMLDHDEGAVEASHDEGHVVVGNVVDNVADNVADAVGHIVADISTAELANANEIQGHPSGESGGSFETDASFMPLLAIDSDHEENNHFHMQLQSLTSVSHDLPSYLNRKFQSSHQNYLATIPSPITRPPIT